MKEFHHFGLKTIPREMTLEDMKNTLEGVARAVDKDALTVLNHERRIRHLEKTSA